MNMTQLRGVQLTSSEFLPANSFVSLNAQKVPVYVFNRKDGSMRFTGAKGPIREIRCSPDLYVKVKETLELRKEDPFFWSQPAEEEEVNL